MSVQCADSGLCPHVGRVFDEPMLEFSVVALDEENSAHAPKGYAVMVVGLTVQSRAGF